MAIAVVILTWNFRLQGLMQLLFFGSWPSVQTEGTSDGVGYATDMAVHIPQGLTQYLGKLQSYWDSGGGCDFLDVRVPYLRHQFDVLSGNIL